MPTDSITKRFVIKDDSVCERLIEALTDPKNKKRDIPNPNAYEEGKKILKRYLSCRKNDGFAKEDENEMGRPL